MSEEKPSFGKALVLGGKTGLLGRALVQTLGKKGVRTLAPGRDELDVLDTAALAAFLDEHAPDVVFNAVAYTKVDQAEDELGAAMLLNRTFPERLGELAGERGTKLVHYSTDFVFDGRAAKPYTPADEPNPTSVYGRTKLAGENALLRLGLTNLIIIRTSWLFGPGGKNFVQTIVNKARTVEELKVVHDQIGSPTYTPDLALHSVQLAALDVHGVFQIANAGLASWCELAAEAVNLAGLSARVLPIQSKDWPQKALRPAYSVLSTEKFSSVTGVAPRPWATALRDYVFSHLCKTA